MTELPDGSTIKCDDCGHVFDWSDEPIEREGAIRHRTGDGRVFYAFHDCPQRLAKEPVSVAHETAT